MKKERRQEIQKWYQSKMLFRKKWRKEREEKEEGEKEVKERKKKAFIKRASRVD